MVVADVRCVIILRKLKHFQAQSQRKLNLSRLCCKDKCLIYLLSCKACGKQYTGTTADKFRSRWNNYKDSDRAFLRCEEIKQKFLHEHFLKDEHHGFEKDVSICLNDERQSSGLHKRGYYWMRTLKTLAPFGLNTVDTY